MNIARIIYLKKIPDSRGNLTAIEQLDDVPFEIRRVYWIFDVPGGERRGGHAYRQGQELIIALSGSFDVTTDNGRESDTFSLNRSYYGLYIPAGTWREISNFSTNAIALIVSSTDYNEEDYIRDYNEFETYAEQKQQHG
ncbi:MAG: FdtA/QdtA family cupin domain-containing protein [Muribaculaceae bacterium]|nr:FdtA/QdtA family cupin domain-containing protein [Muribaculaceae bacterium]